MESDDVQQPDAGAGGFHEVFEQAIMEQMQEAQDRQQAGAPKRVRIRPSRAKAAVAARAVEQPAAPPPASRLSFSADPVLPAEPTSAPPSRPVTPTPIAAPVPRAAPAAQPTAHDLFRDEMRRPLPRNHVNLMRSAGADDPKKDPDFLAKQTRLRKIQRFYNCFAEKLNVNSRVSFKSSVAELDDEIESIREQLARPHQLRMAKSSLLSGVGAFVQVDAAFGYPVLAGPGPVNLAQLVAQQYDTDLADPWNEFVVEYNLLNYGSASRLMMAMTGLILTVRAMNQEHGAAFAAASNIKMRAGQTKTE